LSQSVIVRWTTPVVLAELDDEDDPVDGDEEELELQPATASVAAPSSITLPAAALAPRLARDLLTVVRLLCEGFK
jgi:hypothetical protein